MRSGSICVSRCAISTSSPPGDVVVPVVSLTSERSAEQIGAACAEVGFFSIVDHGVSDDVIDDAWRCARDFFDLPLADRMTVAMPVPGYPYGYSPLAGESLAASRGVAAAPDAKESLAIGPVDPPSHAMADADEAFAWSPNLWPSSLPALRPSWERYYRAMAELAGRLLGEMALALALPSDYFAAMINRHTSAMRALNYPCRDTHVAVDDSTGASAHTDYGTLTILRADPDVGGLQIADSQGEWHDVDPPAGGLVINLGDAMARWTNDRWRSTLHRVQRPTARRQSIAFFHNANWDATIECLPSCATVGEAPKYPPMSAGPHLMHKFRSTVVESGPPSRV